MMNRFLPQSLRSASSRPAGPRSPLVVTLDRKSAPRTIFSGDRLVDIDLPAGSRAVYPRQPLEALKDVDAAIRYALNHPYGSDPLHAKLRPGMKVVIAVDDISLPLPPMRAPDVRERVLTIVLELLSDHGVDDVEIIIATSLHRRMTASEVRHMVGARIFNAYWPKRLYNHDAEDPKGMKEVGATDHGEVVELNRKAVESDLVIYVNLNLVPMDGGHKSVTVGLCGYRSLKHHHDPHTMRKCHSYMDPAASELSTRVNRMGRVTNKAPQRLHHRDDDQQPDVRSPTRVPSQERRRPRRRRAKTALRGLRFDARQAPAGRAPGDLRSRPLPVRRDRRVRRRDGGGARADARQVQRAVLGAGGGAGRHPHRRRAVHQSVQRALLPEPAPRAGDGAGVPLQLLPERAAGEEGGDDDHHPPLLRPLRHGAPRALRRVLPQPPARDAGRARAPPEVRGEVRREPGVPPDVPHPGHAYHPAHPFYMWYWGEAGRQWLGEGDRRRGGDNALTCRSSWGGRRRRR